MPCVLLPDPYLPHYIDLSSFKEKDKYVELKEKETNFYTPVGQWHPSHHPTPSHGEKTVLSTGVTWHWGVRGKAMALWCRGAGKAPALVCWSQEIHRRDHTNPGLRSQKRNQKPPSHPCNPQRGSLSLSTLHFPTFPAKETFPESLDCSFDMHLLNSLVCVLMAEKDTYVSASIWLTAKKIQ